MARFVIALTAAILVWHRLPAWPPNASVRRSFQAGITPPAGAALARELIAWIKVQVTLRLAEQDTAALRGLSPAQLCVLMLLKHPDAFQRLQAWRGFIQLDRHRPGCDALQKAIDPVLRLLGNALRRLPPLAQGTHGYRLVPVADFTTRPHADTADISVHFSVAFAELMSLEEGLAAMADAQREYPESAFSLVVHDDISGHAVDVRPVIGMHRRAMRDCTLMDGHTTDPRVTLPLRYIILAGTHVTCGAVTRTSSNHRLSCTPSHEPGT
jgi:hypothetical protein